MGAAISLRAELGHGLWTRDRQGSSQEMLQNLAVEAQGSGTASLMLNRSTIKIMMSVGVRLVSTTVDCIGGNELQRLSSIRCVPDDPITLRIKCIAKTIAFSPTWRIRISGRRFYSTRPFKCRRRLCYFLAAK